MAGVPASSFASLRLSDNSKRAALISLVGLEASRTPIVDIDSRSPFSRDT
eukprot:CAMPEP_0171593454 /NCGR_PEP_ID=MMETSP0990-20121206/124_1 /TAXON_ID=483369 /ORGANISM="non described non described, Strain CCMP2098" /LENGTH=49 /DNA_ID= /DNA_START= /DNA_END= /DNA_ORIENTATION=